MLVKPSLYSAVHHDGSLHVLWEAEDRTLFLAWLGVRGDCFPVDPVSGKVQVVDGVIQIPFGPFDPSLKEIPIPKQLIVDDVRHDQYMICCRREAKLDDPLWFRNARRSFMTTAPVTFVETLVCRGVG